MRINIQLSCALDRFFLRLARIGRHEEHAAVKERDVWDLHRRRHAGHHDYFVAPVELVCLARIEAQRHERSCRPSCFLALLVTGMAANGIIAAFKSECAQHLRLT